MKRTLGFAFLGLFTFGLFQPLSSNAQSIDIPEWISVKGHYEKTITGQTYIDCNNKGTKTCKVKNPKFTKIN
ncbi:hypothetical protein [Tenacibaculum sp. SZ-18]|uniref:hypothetical protein n=1 Tax=Tenacibaculum sp. SZ-18 TaxID=754423 RepID=UPI0012FD0B99|nr:hypothetical protein [Tenacibaculum sp. SZ-18]